MYYLLFIILSTLSVLGVRAELPPWVYDQWKAFAQEVLVLDLNNVLARSEETDNGMPPCITSFEVNATVAAVTRTTAGLREGDSVSFGTYIRNCIADPILCCPPGPSSPILLESGECILAYLNQTTEASAPHNFALGAGGQSFDRLAECPDLQMGSFAPENETVVPDNGNSMPGGGTSGAFDSFVRNIFIDTVFILVFCSMWI